jgi:hypothetical protein
MLDTQHHIGMHHSCVWRVGFSDGERRKRPVQPLIARDRPSKPFFGVYGLVSAFDNLSNDRCVTNVTRKTKFCK